MILLSIGLLDANNVHAQGACIAVQQHPSLTFHNDCWPQGVCAEACTECRIITIHNLCDCCVDEITIRGASNDTCFSICGETTNPTRASWDNSDPACSTGPKVLTPMTCCPNDEICQGEAIAVKICAPRFPFTVVVEWDCNGTPHTQDFTVN